MTCPLCQDTGYLKRGMVVSPWWADDYVDWCLTLVACSHPASQDGPGEDDTHRTAVVGARVRPESRQGPDRAAEADRSLPATAPDDWYVGGGQQRDLCGSCDAGYPVSCTCQQPPPGWCGHCDGGRSPMYCTCSVHDGEPAAGGAP